MIQNNKRGGVLVIEIEGVGMYSYPVFYGRDVVSTGALTFYADSIVFDSGNTKEFGFKNESFEAVDWQIVEMPSWLSVTKHQGQIEINGAEMLTFMLGEGVNAFGLTTGRVVIETINPNKQYVFNVTYNISIQTYPGHIDEIDGAVVDAEMNRHSNKLYLLTQTPNRITIYDLLSGEKEYIPLSKKPSCMSFTKDFSKVVVGYDVAIVNLIDLSTKNVGEDIFVGTIPFDIAIGEDSICYIAPAKDQWVNMTYVNMTTGLVWNSLFWFPLYEKTSLNMISGAKTMVGISTQISSGPIVLDISNDTISRAVSLNGETGGVVWVTTDGKFVFGRNKYIYRADFLDMDSLVFNRFGELDIKNPFISHMSQNNAYGKVYLSSYTPWDERIGSSYVSVYDMNSYAVVDNIVPSTLVSSKAELLGLNVFYVFVNENNDKLFMVNRLQERHGAEKWYLERRDLK